MHEPETRHRNDVTFGITKVNGSEHRIHVWSFTPETRSIMPWASLRTVTLEKEDLKAKKLSMLKASEWDTMIVMDMGADGSVVLFKAASSRDVYRPDYILGISTLDCGMEEFIWKYAEEKGAYTLYRQTPCQYDRFDRHAHIQPKPNTAFPIATFEMVEKGYQGKDMGVLTTKYLESLSVGVDHLLKRDIMLRRAVVMSAFMLREDEVTWLQRERKRTRKEKRKTLGFSL